MSIINSLDIKSVFIANVIPRLIRCIFSYIARNTENGILEYEFPNDNSRRLILYLFRISKQSSYTNWMFPDSIHNDINRWIDENGIHHTEIKSANKTD